MRLGVAVLAFAGVVAAARGASAEKHAARLIYTRAELPECPDEDSMRGSVSLRLGYDPFQPEAPMLVTAAITREHGGLRAQVEIRDRSFRVTGSRVLTSEKNDCSELAATMALAISMAIDPQSALRGRSPAPPPSLPAPPPT